MSIHRTIRLVMFLGIAAGIGLGYHRLKRSPEQKALTRFVEVELPKLAASEHAIEERIARLGRAPGLKPEEARALLVDDVIPRALRLLKQIGEIPRESVETAALLDEYKQVTERLIDVCRTCVRVIDDPKLSTEKSVAEVRAGFAEVERAFQTWERHLREACARHRLAGPPS